MTSPQDRRPHTSFSVIIWGNKDIFFCVGKHTTHAAHTYVYDCHLNDFVADATERVDFMTFVKQVKRGL